VETKRLIEQVKRNVEGFPTNFMFQLNETEAAASRSQIATSKPGRGGRRYAPYVFTEQGVAMLSGVLRSKRAIAVKCRDHARVRRVAPRDSFLCRTRGAGQSLSERPLRGSADTTSSWIKSSRR
jgi:hypothetical protein